MICCSFATPPAPFSLSTDSMSVHMFWIAMRAYSSVVSSLVVKR